MGDRINIYFKQWSDSNSQSLQPMVMLYSHYAGSYVDEWLSQALNHARPRWSDPFYGVRMIVSHILQGEILSEFGFGLSAEMNLQREENGYRLVDFTDQSVSDDKGNKYQFEGYVNYFNGPA